VGMPGTASKQHLVTDHSQGTHSGTWTGHVQLDCKGGGAHTTSACCCVTVQLHMTCSAVTPLLPVPYPCIAIHDTQHSTTVNPSPILLPLPPQQ
jgi:hypothetical protein